MTVAPAPSSAAIRRAPSIIRAAACARTIALASAFVPALEACRTEQTLVEPDPHLERMLRQEKRSAYEDDSVLPNRMAMQQPPDGTLATEATGAPLVTTGVAGERWVDRVPMALDCTFLETGRRRFDVFCATCHGVLGDGVSIVASKMALRRPPSLHDARIAAYPPGRVFSTIRLGYGLMPSYAVQLSVRDTWAVVAYVRALRLSRGAKVANLPPDVRARLATEAP
ncbi:MAG: cytochrome c [Polyangiaceae bacterium]|jgi:mono/diheme cytochrome c family protein